MYFLPDYGSRTKRKTRRVFSHFGNAPGSFKCQTDAVGNKTPNWGGETCETIQGNLEGSYLNIPSKEREDWSEKDYSKLIQDGCDNAKIKVNSKIEKRFCKYREGKCLPRDN